MGQVVSSVVDNSENEPEKKKLANNTLNMMQDMAKK